MNDPLLQLLQSKARYTNEELAEALSLDTAKVSQCISDWEENGTILGYQAVIDEAKVDSSMVTAFIEVKVTPERGGGFDRLAMRRAIYCYPFPPEGI